MAMQAIIQRVGVAKNKALKFAVMFQRVTVKNSTKFRAWPFPGDPTYIELDPSQWRGRSERIGPLSVNLSPASPLLTE